MFLPDQGALEEKRQAEEQRKQAYRQIEKWSMDLIPANIRNVAVVSVEEFKCGDPTCSPIDTAVRVMFPSGVDGFLGIPMYAHEITLEELKAKFPTTEVLTKWHKGEEADWPPMEDMEFPELRFDVGKKIMCRIGPDAEKDWAPGTIVQLWYAEANWPPGSFAPYKIKLDDGRFIFAPGDMDQVVRAL